MPKRITVDMVRSWGPCYDPATVVGEGWTGTPLDVLNLKHLKSQDKLWVVLREGLIPESKLREFARWCAQVVRLADGTQRGG